MAFIVEDGSARSDATSYCSVEVADAYHADHLYASTWTAANTATKQSALNWATRLLDLHGRWEGYKRTTSQALRWPRAGMYDLDGYAIESDTIPADLKNATAELARVLIGDDRTAEPTRGLASLSVDVITLNFDKYNERGVLPPSVTAFISAYGSAGFMWSAKVVI